MKKIFIFIRKNTVLLIAAAAAAVTCFFVPIDGEYSGYFDLRTLACLFCTLAVVCAFKNIKFFVWLAGLILKKFNTLRKSITALIFITFFGSMILANDMALITFLPLGYYILTESEQKKYMALTFIMQNIAANLGGMLTPFGNPQNLYLFSYYSISSEEFFKIMLPPFITAIVLIIIVCLFIKPVPIKAKTENIPAPPLWRMLVYGVLFAISVMIVFRIFPYYWGLLAVLAGIFATDYKALSKVDYSLLLTFAVFFVFAGNLARIPLFNGFFSNYMAINPLFMGILSCQIISNVPSAILLSKFTADYASLLLAVNIGGLGTPIASLASLITLNHYRASGAGSALRYTGKFLIFNFTFMAVLILSAICFK